LADRASGSVVRSALAETNPWRRRRLLRAHLRPDAVLDDDDGRALEAALDHADVARREAALDVARALGGAALPLLRRLVGHPSARTRRLAIDALAGLGADGAAVLVAAFDDSLLAVRASAVDAYARAMGVDGVPTLLELLAGARTSSVVALAALIGIDAAGATCPRAILARWLKDALTSTVALRLAGRAGDFEALLPAVVGTSPLRRRAAVVGLADAFAAGARIVDVEGARWTLLDAAFDADGTVAAAACVVLGHIGDVAALAQVVCAPDAVRVLPALHRAIALLEAGEREALANELVQRAPGNDVASELVEALAIAPTERATSRAEADFAAAAAWFGARLGLAFDRASHARLRARLAARMEVVGVATLGAYLDRLENDESEALVAFDLVTIHETCFFRDRAQLAAFRHELVPALAASGRRHLVVWSAGCSTGEEAWTIAVLLDDAVRAGVIDDYEVTGTDVSARAIARAGEARYAARAFRDPIDDVERAAFRWEGEAGRAIAQPVDRLRARVRFRALNLLSDVDNVVPRCDVVFCRNVLIYMTDVARARVVEAVRERLLPGGALVLGSAEALWQSDAPLSPWPLSRALVWRREHE
jgi:chemotaxis protein methyltransferase CheR